MEARIFKPSPQYVGKLWTVITLVAFAVLVCGVLLAWLISLDEGPRAGRAVATVFIIANLVWWLPGMMLAGPYYRSLRYEIRDDEVVVYVGIWTKSVKHVPYRTVTNIAIKRDILDRSLFSIGSLNIQTAGMSGTKGAEERLVGLPNVQEVYDIVVGQLRRFRGGMSPTAADSEAATTGQAAPVLDAILGELREIRRTIGK
ncbi:MAG: PH domain-containing protein [Candidatus Krumholzibacteria bacterium]|nr:PH domain-containing protein [Candidatus Krumholzibacteria bacterium]